MKHSRGEILRIGTVAGAIIGAAAFGAFYAWAIEPNWIDWHSENVVLSTLPEGLDGFRIVQLTDLHLGRSISEKLIDRVIDRCNGLNLDLILLTGDLIEAPEREVAFWAAKLSRLKSRFGMVGILGGHDYWLAPDEVKRRLRDAGVRILINEAIAVDTPAGPIWIAGMDDNSDGRHGRPNLARTLEDVPAGAPFVLLAHSPDSIEKIAARDVPIVLCGHTHGGQIRIPLYGPPVTMSIFGRRFASGRFLEKNTMMYVCRGVGTHKHIRFLCRPEVLLLTLRAAKECPACRASPVGACRSL